MSTRLRFTTTDDLVLLREVVGVNPFANPEDWKLIHERVTQASDKNFTLRAIKDHLDLLVKLFQKQDKINIKKSGTEKEYQEKHQLLQEIVDLKREFASKATRTSETEKQKGLKRREAATETIVIQSSTENYVENPNSLQDDLQALMFVPVDEAPSNVVPVIYHENLISDTETEEHSEEPIQEASTSRSSTVLGPIRQRQRRNKTKNPMLDFLMERRQKEVQIREKELQIEERKLALEEARLEMEKKDREEMRKYEMEKLQVRAEESRQQNMLVQTLLKSLCEKHQ